MRGIKHHLLYKKGGVPKSRTGCEEALFGVKCELIKRISRTEKLWKRDLAMKQRLGATTRKMDYKIPPPLLPPFHTTPYFSLSPIWHILPSPLFVCFPYPSWRLHTRNAEGSLTRKMPPLSRLNIRTLLSTLSCWAIALVLAHSTVHFFSQDVAVVLLLLWPSCSSVGKRYLPDKSLFSE